MEPTRAHIEDAAGRLQGAAVRTPLLRSDALDTATGGHLFLKAECLQRTGSFKFRGAYNCLSQIEKGRPVVAFSSGNHAQGVALAARLLGHPAAIVMPSNAPAIKTEGTRAHGAEIIPYDRATESREEIAAALARERDAVLVSSFDDPHVIAGQGTAGLEAREQLAELHLTADLALVCCSGGGLASGIALGLEAPVTVVEPQGYDDVTRSLACGAIQRVSGLPPTLADALQTLQMSERTFAILSSHGARGVTVSEPEIMAAVAFAFRHLKLVLEPSGAVALAAALARRVDLEGKVAVLTLSGGNVDAATFSHCLEATSSN